MTDHERKQIDAMAEVVTVNGRRLGPNDQDIFEAGAEAAFKIAEQATNTGWPHEKKLHEEIDRLKERESKLTWVLGESIYALKRLKYGVRWTENPDYFDDILDAAIAQFEQKAAKGES